MEHFAFKYPIKCNVIFAFNLFTLKYFESRPNITDIFFCEIHCFKTFKDVPFQIIVNFEPQRNCSRYKSRVGDYC